MNSEVHRREFKEETARGLLESHLDQLEGVVQSDQSIQIDSLRIGRMFDRVLYPCRAALEALPPPRGIDEDLPHRERREGKGRSCFDPVRPRRGRQ